MNDIRFQVGTVCFLILLTIIEIVDTHWRGNSMERRDVVLWRVSAKRTGVSRDNFRTKLFFLKNQDNEVALCEERYLAGNRLTDELYLDTGGNRVRLYINVQSDRLFLTVIRGCVHIEHHVYRADKSQRIEIPDRARVTVNDLELEFVRKRVV